MRIRRSILYPVTLALLILSASGAYAKKECKAVYGESDSVLSLATGSPGELGLVKVLAEAFNKMHPVRLCWKKAGSGASLKLLKAKEVDIVLVHAPAAEKAAIKDGWAIKRSLIGSNEFYIVGPESDPAGIKTAKSAKEAYAKISAAKAEFLSRGDNSGTHKKERYIWESAGIKPTGDWYIETKDFMMATLKRADSEPAYFMTDSSTWAAAKKELVNLEVLYRGDPILINTYHALCQPSSATPSQKIAVRFIDFIVSEQGQAVIHNYGMDRYGASLYNDAAYAKQYDH